MSRYSHRLVIQRPTEVSGTRGGPTRTWAQHEVWWADRNAVSGMERFAAQQTGHIVSAQWVGAYRHGYDATMRALVPGKVTTLAASATTATGASLTVGSASGFPRTGAYRIRIGSELMEVIAGQGTTSWTVERAKDGTAGATHAAGAKVEHMQVHDIEMAEDSDGMRREMTLKTRETDGVA